MIYTKLSGVAFVGVLLICVPSDHAQAAGHTYENKRYSYTFVVPHGWRIEQGDVPYIYKYPPSEEAPQGQLPKRSAVVRLVPLELYLKDGYVENLEQWINWNTRVKQRDVRRVDLPCPSGASRRASICTEVTSISQLTPQDPALVWVSYYFVFNGKHYRAFLECHEGDPNRAIYVSALRRIVRSVRARPQ